MTATFFVKFNERGFVQAYKSDGFDLKQGEYATQINLEVPDEAFTPMPVPIVQITLPKEALRRTFNAEIQDGEIQDGDA
jgi:hypothetical protein